MYVRRGGIVLQGPEMNYTGERPWDPVTVDAYPLDGADVTRALYEDDGQSNAYLDGAFRVTPVKLSSSSGTVRISIDGAKGEFAGAVAQRAWVLRVHLLPGHVVSAVSLDGQATKYR